MPRLIEDLLWVITADVNIIFIFCFAVLLKNAKREEEKPFRDCADAYQAGFNKSGVYTIYVTNISEPKKVKKSMCFFLNI